MSERETRTAQLVTAAQAIIVEVVYRDLDAPESMAALRDLGASQEFAVFASLVERAARLEYSRNESYTPAEEVVIAA